MKDCVSLEKIIQSIQNLLYAKISHGEGVERVFPLFSPIIDKIEVIKKGGVKRAKLYYLRKRTGKSSRIAIRDRGEEADQYVMTESQEPISDEIQKNADASKGSENTEYEDTTPKKENTVKRRIIKYYSSESVAEEKKPVEENLSQLLLKQKRQKMKQNPKTKTLFDKIWLNHLVHKQEDDTSLIYIDRHLVHEVTSPQAFEGLRNNNRKVRKPQYTFAVADHNVPTSDRSKGIKNEDSRIQVETLEKNCKDFDVTLFPLLDKRQGIVHIIGPEQGITQPGMTIVCGDSHTATHGAFGALAFGIGTSEVEHVLATQTLIQNPAKNMRITIEGKIFLGVTAKDIILHIIGHIGTAGGTGYVIEYAGEAIQELSMEGRMTICNMSIEGGARAGLISPDQKLLII